MEKFKFGVSLFILLLLVAGCRRKEPSKVSDIEQQNQLKMNEIQCIASHNSYRLRTYSPIYDFVVDLVQANPSVGYNPEEWDYTHLPIPEQLADYRIRGLELDIYYDPNGGNFSKRGGMLLVNEPAESGIPALDEPGMKIIHIPDLDFMTNYYTFKEALQAVKTWSEANPNHLPLYINVEAKNETPRDKINIDYFVYGIPFGAAGWDALDEEVKSVFGKNMDKIITPDKIRGTYPSLKEAVQAGNWWNLERARGKIVFILNMNKTKLREYADGHPSFAGRSMFVYTTNDSLPEAAFIVKNDAIDDKAEIASWVRKGYIVRTRADAGTKEARTGDYSTFQNALESGAQIISTDYYRPDPRHTTDPAWTNYKVELPNKAAARSNPVLELPYKGDILE